MYKDLVFTCFPHIMHIRNTYTHNQTMSVRYHAAAGCHKHLEQAIGTIIHPVGSSQKFVAKNYSFVILINHKVLSITGFLGQ